MRAPLHTFYGAFDLAPTQEAGRCLCAERGERGGGVEESYPKRVNRTRPEAGYMRGGYLVRDVGRGVVVRGREREEDDGYVWTESFDQSFLSRRGC